MPPAARFAASAHIREDRHYQMGGKPYIVIAHCLIDVDQYQNTRKKHAEKHVGPLWNRIYRKQMRVHQQIDQHHDPRHKKRKQQKVEVHMGTAYSSQQMELKIRLS